MDANKVKQILNKFLKEEPTIVGNLGSLFWVKNDLVAFLRSNKYNSNEFTFTIRKPVNRNGEVDVLNQKLELDEKELCTLKLKMMEFKENYENKLFDQLLASDKSDPMDELLEDPKDE